MVRQKGGAIPPNDFILPSKNRLKMAIETCETGLEAANKIATPGQKAELIAAIYQLLDVDKQPDTHNESIPDNVISIIKAANI